MGGVHLVLRSLEGEQPQRRRHEHHGTLPLAVVNADQAERHAREEAPVGPREALEVRRASRSPASASRSISRSALWIEVTASVAGSTEVSFSRSTTVARRGRRREPRRRNAATASASPHRATAIGWRPSRVGSLASPGCGGRRAEGVRRRVLIFLGRGRAPSAHPAPGAPRARRAARGGARRRAPGGDRGPLDGRARRIAPARGSRGPAPRALAARSTGAVRRADRRGSLRRSARAPARGGGDGETRDEGAGDLVGARTTAELVDAVELLRGVLCEALLEEAARCQSARQTADLCERVAHVCAAMLAGLAAGECRPRSGPAPVGRPPEGPLRPAGGRSPRGRRARRRP